MKANGVILKYDLCITLEIKLERLCEIADNEMHTMLLPPGKQANIEITANNSVGVSPKATLFIPRSDQGILKTSVFFISYFKQFMNFLTYVFIIHAVF